MARAEFTRELSVAASPEKAWATITDVPRLVRWISVLEGAREVEPLSRYTAVLADRIGMFSLRADLDIRVLEQETGSWLRAAADGQDRQMGSRIAVEATVRLSEDQAGTALAIAGMYEVTGRVATLGSSTIHRKADAILAEFAGNLERELA